MDIIDRAEDYIFPTEDCPVHDWGCVQFWIGTKEYHFTTRQAKAVGLSLYLVATSQRWKSERGEG